MYDDFSKPAIEKKKPARTDVKPYNRATEEKLGLPEKRIKTNNAPSHAQSAEGMFFRLNSINRLETKLDAMSSEASKQLYK